ncbi:MAG: hypothetical protein ACYTJ0_07060 [Planctomycetota bacterium]|jgi:hypothetical protein
MIVRYAAMAAGLVTLAATAVAAGGQGGCPEDINGDGGVDVDDLLIVILEWAQPGGPADIDGDGTVSVDDLIAVIQAWGACPADVVLHVDDNAPAGGTGSTWALALRHLQDALALGADEIRVAGGAYRPDRSAAAPDGTGDRTASFALLDGVRILGGYAGFGGPDPDERDVARYETILSGDLLGDDGPPGTFAGMEDNAYHVVDGSGAGATAVLDGVTITAGNASEPAPSPNREGGGVLVETGAPVLVDCVLRHNLAAFGGAIAVGAGAAPSLEGCELVINKGTMAGGALSSRNGSPRLVGCALTGNTASNGGAVHASDGAGPASSIRLIDCTLAENGCPDPGFGGGAIFVDSFFATSPARLDLARCRIVDNVCDSAGGAIFARAAHVAIVDCVLARNEGNAGGALYVQRSERFATTVRLDASTIIDNTAGWTGGAMLAVYPDESPWPGPLLANCILWGNAPNALADSGGGTTEARYCVVEGGYPGDGNLDADPELRDPAAGDYRLSVDSPCLDAGSTAALPPDVNDLDGDDDVDEPLPVDLTGGLRVRGPAVDIGAVELNEQVLGGTEPDELYGLALAIIDDVDGDGRADVAIGGPGRAGQRGAVELRSGATGALLWTHDGDEPGAQLGRSLAAAGDVNGDGIADVVAGAPQSGGTGAVMILSGVDGAVLGERSGTSDGDRYGWSVAGNLDVDDDGALELLVGAPLRGGGRVYVLRAANLQVEAVLAAEGDNDRFGWSVAALGRVDSGPEEDFVVGAPRNDDNAPDAGKIYVYSGEELEVLYSRRGAQANERFGTAVASAGRVDGDNRIDIAVGAPLRDGDDGADAGRIVVYSGASGTALYGCAGAAGSLLGQAIVASADVDGDQSADLVVGAPGHLVATDAVGAVRVLVGTECTVHFETAGDWPGGAFGRAVAAVPATADAPARVIIGAPNGGPLGAGEVRLVDVEAGTP